MVAAHVRDAVGKLPYIVKIGHVRTQEQAAKLLDALAPYADALAMTNSVAATVATENGQLLSDGQRRGICGDATREASLGQVQLFASLINFPVVWVAPMDHDLVSLVFDSHPGTHRRYR